METKILNEGGTLWLLKKFELINDSEKGNSVANLALIYKVGEQTVRDILKKFEIRNYTALCNDKSSLAYFTNLCLNILYVQI